MAAVLPKLPSSVFDDVATSASDRQATKTAEGSVIAVVLGRQRLGARLLPVGFIGTDFVMACGWCLGEIDAIEELTINGLAPPESVTVTHYLGTPTQGIDPTLAEAIAGYDDAGVGVFAGEVVAAAYTVLRIPKDAVSGFPRVEAVIRGLKLFDPRTGVTAYSTNPALALRAVARSRVFGSGLLTEDAGDIDSANASDDIMPGGAKRREIGLVMDSPAPCAQWLDILRGYAGCFIVRRGGTIRQVPDRPASTITALGPHDIVEGSLRLSKRSLRNIPTVVRVVYTDTTSTPWRDLPAVAYLPGVLDGTVPWREDVVQMPGIPNYAQAYREAVERLNSATLTDLDAEWVGFDEAIEIEEGDVRALTHPIGLAAKEMRILSIAQAEPGRWRIQAAEYNPAVYSDEVVDAPGSDSPLPSPSTISEITELAAFSGTEQLIDVGNGMIISSVRVTWEPPVNLYYWYTRVRYRISGAEDWTYLPDAINSAVIAPVQDGAILQIQGQAVNDFGITSDWVEITHQVVGETEPPGPARDFRISRDPDGTRRLTWLWPDPWPLDVKYGGGAVIRYAHGLDADPESMMPLHDGILVSSPYETNSLAAGDYTFEIVIYDRGGRPSTPVYIEATLGDPRLADALEVQASHLDGWPGTKTDCWVHPQTGWLLAKDNKTVSELGSLTPAEMDQWTVEPKTMVYTTPVIDVGLVTRFTPIFGGVFAGTPTLEIRTSLDNVTWSSWAAPAGLVSARYIQGRVTIVPVSNGFTAAKELTLILDAKVISEAIVDLDTASLTGAYRIGTGDVRLPKTKTYSVIRQVGDFALQNVGSGWSWTLVDKDTTVGPRIKIYNNGVLADAVIDATIRGLP